jgi:hypothetical protein
MAGWSTQELSRIGVAEEIAISVQRPDGTLRPPVTIWVVRVGDDIYVRSFKGHDGGWFSHAKRTHTGRIQAAGTERDITFDDPISDVHRDVDAAYRTKYGHYRSLVDQMVSPAATAATFRISPR